MSTSKTDSAAANRRQYWPPLLELSAQEVFGLMLGEKLESAAEPVAIDSLDVTAMVGLAGSLCGLLTLRCNSECAARIATRMLGADVAGTRGQVEDAIGEVCNMVAGNFKNKLSGMSDSCKLSVPTVITGSNYNLCTPTSDYSLEVCILFHENPVVISLQLN